MQSSTTTKGYRIATSQTRLSSSSSSSQQILVWEQTISSANASNATTSPGSTNGEEPMQYSPNGRILYRPAASITHGDKRSGWEEVVVQRDAAMLRPSASENIVPITSTEHGLSGKSRINGNYLTNVLAARHLPFLHHFLPARYPHSVCSSYSSYASYCFIGSIAGSAGMVLSTQALLVAVGVGTQSAAPMAAALNWVMKDGMGQLGGILFASQLGSGGIDWDYWRGIFRRKQQPTPKKSRPRSGGSGIRGNFQQGTADSNPKRWRMVAALALDISTLLEICTPLMGPEWFLLCASVANVGKNIGFLAASASRAAIHQSLSMGGSGGSSTTTKVVDDSSILHSHIETSQKKRIVPTTSGSNLGDVTAKAGSQAIVASLLGTALGIFLSQTFCSDYGTAGILAGFVVLSAMHQVCTYQAVKVVPIRSLDRHRLHIVLTSYMSVNSLNGEKLTQILTPEQVAEKESFLPMMPPDDSVRWLSIGDSLMDICPSGAAELRMLLLPYKPTGDKSLKDNIDFGCGPHDYEKYILKVSPPSNAKSEDGMVQLTFFEGAADHDIVRGMFHSYAAQGIMKSHRLNCNGSMELSGQDILRETHSKMTSDVPIFINKLQDRGWQIGTGFVNVECGSSHRLTIRNA